MTESDHTTTSTTRTVSASELSKIRGALLRYRVLAWVTGLWLLLLCVELIAKYGFNVNSLDIVPIVHGWVYFLYLIMAIDLGIRVRWPFAKFVYTLIAGTIPFLSFYVEHVRTKQIKSEFNLT